MSAMDELGRARTALRTELLRGRPGRMAEDRAQEFIDEHQSALKRAHAHQLAEDIRANCHLKPGQCGCYTAADLIDPEVTR